MYDVIKKYAENDKPNGLMLIDMPTGDGGIIVPSQAKTA